MVSDTVLINETASRAINRIAEYCKKEKPMVAIWCITYNQANYIRKTLDGFINQKTSFRFVAIVHDDASTDGTSEVIKEYANRFPEIIFPILEIENQYSKKNGFIGAIIRTAAAATGAKYYAECEGDDYWLKTDKLQRQFNILESHSECTIAVNRVQKVDKSGFCLNSTIPPAESFKEGEFTLGDLVNHEFLKGKWTFQTSSFFFREEMVQLNLHNKKTVFKDFPYGDMPLLLTCLLNGNGYYIDEIMGCYTVLSGGYNSSMRSNKKIASQNYLKVGKALKAFNEYTRYQYNKELKRAIRRYQFNAEVVADKKLNLRLFLPKYRHFYRIALLKFAEALMPGIYNKLQKSRH